MSQDKLQEKIGPTPNAGNGVHSLLIVEGETAILNNRALVDLGLTPGQISDGYHTFDELYTMRNALFIAFCNVQKGLAWKSKAHEDGSMFEGYFIAGFRNNPGNQISFHLPLELWDQLHVKEYSTAVEWDGHKDKDKIYRLLNTVA